MSNMYESGLESQIEILEQLELPEGVELLERSDSVEGMEQLESVEISVPREALVETTEVADGLEMDVVSKEVLESVQEPTYEYSEAYIDEWGVYHPAQISGIYSDCLEDPECQEMIEDLKTWQKQEEQMSCAVQCQRMIIEDLTGKDVTEAELRDLGRENGWFNSIEGTRICDVGKLAEYHGLERQQYEYMTMDEMIEIRDAGANLIVGVDAYLLAQPYLNKICSPNHAVEVIGVDRSDPENPMVILNDPGRTEGRGSAYPMEIFMKAAGEVNPETGRHELYSVTAIYAKEAAK